MARDTGPLTSALAAVQFNDPSRTFALTAATSVSNVITYTATVGSADLRKILSVGSAVVITGASNNDFNFDDGNNRAYGTVGSLSSTSKVRAVIASIPSASTFTVVSPVSISDASVASALGATLYQDTSVGNQPLDNASTWKSADQGNIVIAREWGNTAPIQPNTDRLGTTKPISAATANGVQIALTSASHGLTVGQYIQVNNLTNAAGKPVDRVNTRYVIAATATNTITVNSTFTGALVAASAQAVVLTPLNGTQNVTDATFSTAASPNTATIAYTTATPHGYVVGQTVNVVGASNENFNAVAETIVATGATSVTLQTPIYPVTAVSVATGSADVTYTIPAGHGLATGEKVWIKNITTNNAAVAATSSEATIKSVTPTSFTIASGSGGVNATTGNTFTYATGADYAQAFKGVNGSFSGTARLNQADSSWGQAFAIPSGTLLASQDNHDRVTNPDSAYPDFTPKFTPPYVVGALQAPDNQQAIRAFKAAGFTNISPIYAKSSTGAANGTAGTQITAASGDGTNWTYTANAHGLVPGQIVTVSNVGAFNVKDAVITTTAANTFSVANTTQPTALSGLTAPNLGSWSAYNTLSASSISLAATAAGSVATVTTATPHGLKVGDIIGIGGTTTVTGFKFAYVPTSVVSTNYAAGTLTAGTAVASVTSPTVFTYLTPATASSTTLGLTNGLVNAYNSIVTAASVTTATTDSNIAGTVTALPNANVNNGGVAYAKA